MASEFEDFLVFFSSSSPQVKMAAVDIVRGLTGSEDGLALLAAHADLALPPLARLLLDAPDVAAAAAESLINLSQNPDLAEKLVALGGVPSAMDIIYKPAAEAGGCPPNLVRLLVMLLANLTQLDSGAKALLQAGDDKMEGLYITKLVRSFCRSSSGDSEDVFEHVASILVNITKVDVGRKIILEPKRGLMKQVIRQFDSTNPLRKKGVSGTIRNCCFEADNQLDNLLLTSEFLWPALLLPVSGNKVYSEQDRLQMPSELSTALSHEREPVDDSEIRMQTLEAIYLIALHEAGRRALWSVNGTRILQVGYEEEEDPKVMEVYELIGSLLVENGEDRATIRATIIQIARSA